MLNYEEAIRFHGHNGPFLAIGYKAGIFALDALRPKGIMDLRCRVSVVLKKPFTCVIDGIQASSCCTSGKGNLSMVESPSNLAKMSFQNIKTGKSIELKIKKEIFEIANNSSDLERDANLLLNTKPEELFEICMNGH